MRFPLLAAAVTIAGCAVLQPTSRGSILILKSQIIEGRYTQTQISPYTQASIHHLTLELHRLSSGTPVELVATKTLYAADLNVAVTFSSLKAGTSYRVQALAYDSGNTLISTSDANSYTDVTLGNDDRPNLSTLKVKLIDRAFNGQGTGSITVSNGGYLPQDPENLIFQGLKGIVTTLAGSTAGTANGFGVAAQFNQPIGLAQDNAGYLYEADYAAHLIRKINKATGEVTTLAGSTAGTSDGVGTAAQFNSPVSLAVDNASKTLYVADISTHLIRRINLTTAAVTTIAGSGIGSQDGTGTAAKFSQPRGLSLDNNGNLYIADYGNNRIRKLNTNTLEVTTVAGGTAGYLDANGTSAQFNGPTGITAASNGLIYVADWMNNRIRRINTTTWDVTTLAGGNAGCRDGIGTLAQFNIPKAVEVDAEGNLYVSDTVNNRIRKIYPSTGLVVTVAGGSGGYADGTGGDAKFSEPNVIVVDNANSCLYIADRMNNRIRKLE